MARFPKYLASKLWINTNRYTDKQTHTQTDRQTHRYTDTSTDTTSRLNLQHASQ